MYLDSPEERIYDEFLELFYPDHPLGTNILGSKEGLKQFKRTHLLDFRERTFLANRIILVVVSPIKFERVLKMATKYFEHLPLKSGTWKRKAPKTPQHFDIIQYNGFSQAHVMMGCEAFEIGHDARPALMLLSNILGGPGLNSKLNLVLREKLGYTYSVDSSYQSLTDSGCFSIYWSTDQKNVKKSKKAILNVLNGLIQSPLTLGQLHKYKTQFKGQMIMAEESDISLMFVIGKSLLDLDYCDSLNDILEKIDSISPSEIQDLAAELLAPDKWSYLTYLPEKDS
jgi:predicted Zn-dependent peptidase